MSIKKIEDFFDEGITYTFGDKAFKVDESYSAFMKFKIKYDKLKRDGIKEDDKAYMDAMMTCAFGAEDWEELQNLKHNGRGIPFSKLLEIVEDVNDAWSGQKKGQTPRQ